MFPVRVRWGWFSIVWKARHGQSRPAGNGQRKSSCTCPWPRITGSARGGRGLSGPCLVLAQRGAGDRQAIPRRASSRLRSSATALPDRRLAGSLTFGSRCLFPSGVTSIFRVSLTGLSTPPFRRLFGLPLFFFPFFLLSPPPTFHARAGLTVSAVALPPPCRFLGHPPELGLAVLRAARAAALAGGAAGPCSALRRGRRWVGSPEGMHACRPCSPAGRAKLFWDWRCVLRGRESLALPCGSRTRGVPRVLDSVKNVGAAGFSLIPSSL